MILKKYLINIFLVKKVLKRAMFRDFVYLPFLLPIVAESPGNALLYRRNTGLFVWLKNAKTVKNRGPGIPLRKTIDQEGSP